MTVELVGPEGSTPLKTTLMGYKGIANGSTLYFTGKLYKKGEHVKVIAQRLYVAQSP